MKFKIALVQFAIRPVTPEENLERAAKLIKKATNEGANVVVFPEEFVTGSVNETDDAVDHRGRYREALRQMARDYRVDLVAGSLIEENKDGRFNVAYYFNSKGKTLAAYKKVNLYLSERDHLKTGDRLFVFKTRYGKAALLICWDLTMPELFRELVRRGVEIVYCPAYWWKEIAGDGLKYDADVEERQVDALCTTRAFENNIVLVYVNAGGQCRNGNKMENLIGHSQITAPFLGPIVKIDDNEEKVVVAEVDTKVLLEAEKVYKKRRDLLGSYFGNISRATKPELPQRVKNSIKSLIF